MPNPSIATLYKQLTLPQLRSFCETMRLGSISAAAKSLRLTHPTVWKQVHALSELFGTPLLETHRRGCRSTPAGEDLLKLVRPLIEALDSLETGFRTAVGERDATLDIAASPRTVAEDLPAFLKGFAQRHPEIRVILHEVRDLEIPCFIAERKADLGLTGIHARALNEQAALEMEPAYEIELRLIAPKRHPVAQCDPVQAADLAAWPLLNAIDLFPSDSVTSRLRELGCHEHPQKRFELTSASTLRTYVRLGLGLAITGALRGRPAERGFHEASLTHLLGPLQVFAIHRRTHTAHPTATLFLEEVRREFGGGSQP